MQRESPPHALPPGHARPPECLVYCASYQLLGGGGSITIWQYPTKAWARYETRHISGYTERVVGDQRVLASALETFWLSDNMMIRVSGQQVEMDAMLGAYLAKYPSDVEASFPFFTLATKQ